LDLLRRLLRKASSNSTEKNPAPSATESADGGDAVQVFREKFGIQFHNPQLLITALKHRSYLNITNEPRIHSNERLEFLGDAVLDLIVTHYLYEKFPQRTEGQLSKVKSILVSKPVLADIAVKISLGEMILINWGEEKTGGRQRQSILADAFEAVIGAIFLDQGLDVAQRFVQQHLLNDFQKIIRRGLYRNYKSILLEFVQSKGQGLPEYRVVQEFGPDHAKEFVVQVRVGEEVLGEGRGKSKKIAEQEAAKMAVKKLHIVDNWLE